jgi:hypothetical protein
MERKVFSGFLAAGLFVMVAVSVAHAEPSITITAKVPFAFSIGTTSLQAGEYTINEFSSGVILVRKDSGNQLLNMTCGGSSRNAGDRPKLVFHRYEDQYFLSEVFSGMGDPSRKLPVSKLEKEQMRAVAHVAAEKARPRDVLVEAALTTR